MKMLKSYHIEIPEFITHIAKTNNKTAPNKFIKINNQLIYNSNLNRFARNVVVDNMHQYLIAHILKSKIKLTDPPYQIGLDIYVPINYGNISRRKKDGIYQIVWNEPSEDYVPTWDIGNLGEIWLKTFEDSLQLARVIENDHIGYVNSHGPITFKQVDEFKNRKLVFNINKLE